MNDYLILAIIFASSVLSGMLAFSLSKGRERNFKHLLSFSGAFLMGIAFLVIIPEIYESENTEFIGLWVLAGFLLQLLLDIITRGIEHGHLAGHEDHPHDHSHEEIHEKPKSTFYITIFIGLCLHAFLEGMPFISSVESTLQTSLMAGIVIHNIPIAIVLVSFFLHSGVSKKNTILLLAFFSLMTPIGGLCSNFFSDYFSVNIQTYTNTIMAFVVGIFLHVSTSILFEACENHKYNLVRFVTVVFGVAVAFAVSALSH